VQLVNLSPGFTIVILVGGTYTVHIITGNSA
jgi:hypothetical protein